MDVYKEQLVKKAITSNDRLKTTGLFALVVIIGTILITMALFAAPNLLFVAIVGAGGLIYGAFYLAKDMQVEYEYLYTNGELDIDKIMGQRKRKRLVTVNIGKVTSFGKYSENLEISDSVTTIDASSGFEENHWYMTFAHRDYGECCMFFTPNDEMLQLLVDNLPRTVRQGVDI